MRNPGRREYPRDAKVKGSSDREMFGRNHGELSWKNCMNSIQADNEDGGLERKEILNGR
jgi:hypothetical protein